MTELSTNSGLKTPQISLSITFDLPSSLNDSKQLLSQDKPQAFYIRPLLSTA